MPNDIEIAYCADELVKVDDPDARKMLANRIISLSGSVALADQFIFRFVHDNQSRKMLMKLIESVGVA